MIIPLTYFGFISRGSKIGGKIFSRCGGPNGFCYHTEYQFGPSSVDTAAGSSRQGYWFSKIGENWCSGPEGILRGWMDITVLDVGYIYAPYRVDFEPAQVDLSEFSPLENAGNYEERTI